MVGAARGLPVTTGPGTVAPGMRRAAMVAGRVPATLAVSKVVVMGEALGMPSVPAVVANAVLLSAVVAKVSAPMAIVRREIGPLESVPMGPGAVRIAPKEEIGLDLNVVPPKVVAQNVVFQSGALRTSAPQSGGLSIAVLGAVLPAALALDVLALAAPMAPAPIAGILMRDVGMVEVPSGDVLRPVVTGQDPDL